MAVIHRSVLKRARQAEKRRKRNFAIKSQIKTLKRKALEGNKEALNEFYSLVDKAVKKGIIHKNTGARKKSRLTKLVHLRFSSAQSQ
jgi:small subunit ribosomal protein S20